MIAKLTIAYGSNNEIRMIANRVGEDGRTHALPRGRRAGGS